MELSFGSEYNKEEFEKKIKEINEYDGSLLERSPYAGWEEIDVKKVALDGQKKKREKSIQNRWTWAIGLKHLRGRHDQRDHNRWPAGYQAQTYVPTGRRAGAMAARATGGLVGTTQMNILANTTNERDVYKGNPIYDESLFSSNAEFLTRVVGQMTARKMRDTANAADVAREIGLDINNPADMKILADAFKVYIDPSESPAEQLDAVRIHAQETGNDKLLRFRVSMGDVGNQVNADIDMYISADSIVVKNEYFGQQGYSGIGYNSTARQIAALMEISRRAKRGVTIQAKAQSDLYGSFTGYQVWPRMIYNFQIPLEVQRELQDMGYNVNSTYDLMLSSVPAQSKSGSNAKFNGQTPIQFWASLIDDVLAAEGEMSVPGETHIPNDTQDNQMKQPGLQVLLQYTELLRKKTELLRKKIAKKSLSTVKNSDINKYLETIGFSTDEMAMFDEAWGNIKKSAKKPKKNEKSVAIAQQYKHLRGRHDQRDHNRWPAGYQAQTYTPSGRRAGAMASRATGGLVGTTQMNILANRTKEDILTEINQQNAELINKSQAIRGEKVTLENDIGSFQMGLRNIAKKDFEVSTALSLLDVKPDYDIELLFDHLVEKMAEKIPSLMSSEKFDSLTYRMRTAFKTSQSQQEIEDAIIKLMQDTQDRIGELRKNNEEGLPRYRMEYTSNRIIGGLSDINIMLNHIGEKFDDEIPGLEKLMSEYTARVQPFSNRKYTSDINDLQKDVTDITKIFQSMIDSDAISEKEKDLLRNEIDSIQSSLDTTIEKEVNANNKIMQLNSEIADININIAQLKKELSNLARESGQVGVDEMYADNKEIYDAELFSTDATELTAQSGQLMYRIANNDVDVEGFAADLQLDVDNLADMQMLADLVGIFTEGADFASTKNVSVIANTAPDRDMAVNLKLYTTSGGFIKTDRLITIDDSQKTIDVESISVEQENLRGIGYAMTVRQIAAAMELSRRTGYKVALRLDAVSRLGSKWRGYNVWPKLGYDFMIPSAIADALNDLGFTHNRTSDLMLDKSTAKSSSGKYSQYDGKTPVELWNDLVEELLQDEYQFSEVGAIVVSPDDVETQQQNIDMQVMIEYNKLLRKKLGKTTKAKRKNAEYDAYALSIGFSADEMAMFDEAWGNIKKSTKKPKKNKKSVAIAQQYKHLRGRHDQRDHAWNRGMGRGATPAGGDVGAFTDMQAYQATRQSLFDKIRSGEMTRSAVRNQLRQMRGLPTVSRRQDLMASRAMGFTANLTPQGGSGSGRSKKPLNVSQINATNGPLLDVRLAKNWFNGLINFQVPPSMPALQRMISLVTQSMSPQKIQPMSPPPAFNQMVFRPFIYDALKSRTIRGDEVKPNYPNARQIPSAFASQDITSQQVNDFNALDAKFGITTWQLNESVDQSLIDEINATRLSVANAKADIINKLTNYNDLTAQAVLIQEIMNNLADAYLVIQHDRNTNQQLSEHEANVYSTLINEFISAGQAELNGLEAAIDVATDDVRIAGSNMSRISSGAHQISAPMLRFLQRHFGKSVNPTIQSEQYFPSTIKSGDGSRGQIARDEKLIAKQIVNDANKFIEQFIDKRLLPKNVRLQYDSDSIKAGLGSSFYEGSKSIFSTQGLIFLSENGSNSPVFLHELMHAISDEDLDRRHGSGFMGLVQDKSIVEKFNRLVMGFFASRFAQNNQVIEENNRNIVWAPDNFPDWYAGLLGDLDGKVFPIEIVSMGVSMLLADPVKFAKTQPDYFRFLSVLLSGAWIK